VVAILRKINLEYYEADEEYEIIDWDARRYYPAIGIK